ncbi:iron ABC transporter permease [Sinanaerobacter sp. ZZT-01]|uniref:FecCD family ABC transporter permease n=1 Tax=Sinanaerobacter sp. ZZT-01 TaxID=3111540 RepID=UPI002D79FC26|nr:iron ABC transporter permease [Sinanaerobacter sp. ZZT-01]WRR93430.1 iron ABC transporter permease [Sinanaerobacter sp. ZZT-01]
MPKNKGHQDLEEMNRNKSITLYKNRVRRNKLIILTFIASTVIIAFYALNKGAAPTAFIEIINAFFHSNDELAAIVLWNIRMPRILAGIFAGAGLALAGCVMQTNLRNPLASPSTLGISGAAAFGANIAIVFFNAGVVRNSSEAVMISNPYLVTICAFVGAVIAMFFILLIARIKSFSPESIVLAGVAFSSLFSAGSTLIQYFASDYQVAAMVFWTFGDLGRISWSELKLLFLVTAAACVYVFFHRWDYNAIDSGEESARSLGVDVSKVRFESMFAASLLTAISVSFMGIIGFVGLVAPQMMKRLLGADHRFLIPASAIMGSFLLLLSDTIARTLLSPVVLPVGVITSFFGAPLFLFLLVRGYSKT